MFFPFKKVLKVLLISGHPINLQTKSSNTVFIPAAQKMKFLIKDFFSKCDQIRSFRGFGHIY